MSTEFSEWWKNLGTVKQALMISCIAIVLIAIVCMIIALVMMNKKNKTNDQNKTDDETQNNQDNNRQSEEEENINNLNTNNLNQNTNNISNVNENQNNNTLNTNNMMSESFSQNSNINSSENNNLQNNQSNGILTPSDLETDGYKKGTILYPNGAKRVIDGVFKNGRLFNGMIKVYHSDGWITRQYATNGKVREVSFNAKGKLAFEGVTANGKMEGRVYSDSGKIIEEGLYDDGYRFIDGEKQIDVNDPDIENGEKVFVGTFKDYKPYNGHWLEKKDNDFYKVSIVRDGEKKQSGLILRAEPDDFINKRIQENLVNNNISTNVNLNLNNSNINNIEL